MVEVVEVVVVEEEEEEGGGGGGGGGEVAAAVTSIRWGGDVVTAAVAVGVQSLYRFVCTKMWLYFQKMEVVRTRTVIAGPRAHVDHYWLYFLVLNCDILGLLRR